MKILLGATDTGAAQHLAEIAFALSRRSDVSLRIMARHAAAEYFRRPEYRAVLSLFMDNPDTLEKPEHVVDAWMPDVCVTGLANDADAADWRINAQQKRRRGRCLALFDDNGPMPANPDHWPDSILAVDGDIARWAAGHLDSRAVHNIGSPKRDALLQSLARRNLDFASPADAVGPNGPLLVFIAQHFGIPGYRECYFALLNSVRSLQASGKTVRVGLRLHPGSPLEADNHVSAMRDILGHAPVDLSTSDLLETIAHAHCVATVCSTSVYDALFLRGSYPQSLNIPLYVMPEPQTLDWYAQQTGNDIPPPCSDNTALGAFSASSLRENLHRALFEPETSVVRPTSDTINDSRGAIARAIEIIAGVSSKRADQAN
jgi:hypothetical protein